MERLRIEVSGLVQGVGFRPFIHRLACRKGLTGWVRNNFAGMEIEIQGPSDALAAFREELPAQAPRPARIDQLTFQNIPPLAAEKAFAIRDSEDGVLPGSPLPDQGICPQCAAEYNTSQDRRYRYPFNSCAICGPRFTIIERLPFDRQRTAMAEFPLCPQCRTEYGDPADRRFHAQTIACPECGPALWFAAASGQRLSGDPVEQARRVLDGGGILGIKGIGGYHLACRADSGRAVRRLRELKGRDSRAFAVMFRDLAALGQECETNRAEEAVLTDPARPIVLLRQKQGTGLAREVNPGLSEIGAFLPYTAIQMLLFSDQAPALVMTSGNRSGEPLTTEDGAAFRELGAMADGFLGHNRHILWRCDDSVVRVQGGRIVGIRRSRGYAPVPVKVAATLPPLLACGAQQKNVFALTKGDQVFLSAHQGDLDNLTTFLAYRETVARWARLLDCQPEWAVHDLHPDYQSTRYARDTGLRTVALQHHLAHVASVIAAQNIRGAVIGIAFDGSGYGTDGRVWGGEFFTGSGTAWRRAAHLQYYPLPGGEAAIWEPWRMAASYLAAHNSRYLQEWLSQWDLEAKWRHLQAAAKLGINAPETSSLGRLFDGAAALLGGILSVAYEGEAAIWLENRAEAGVLEAYDYRIESRADGYRLDPGAIMAQLAADIPHLSAGIISMKFHRTIANMTCEMVRLLRDATGIRQVALSGGVFQNRLLLDLTSAQLEKDGYAVHIPEIIPVNDGGIALGQAWLGGLMIERGVSDVLGSSW